MRAKSKRQKSKVKIVLWSKTSFTTGRRKNFFGNDVHESSTRENYLPLTSENNLDFSYYMALKMSSCLTNSLLVTYNSEIFLTNHKNCNFILFNICYFNFNIKNINTAENNNA